MAPHSHQAQQDVAHIHLEHAYIMLAGDKESWRASLWNSLQPRVRKMIVWMAGLDGSKADVPFQSLTALERGKIHCTARRLMKELPIILRCAQGGEVSDHFIEASRVSDGLAA
jgi:hypothetical protein